MFDKNSTQYRSYESHYLGGIDIKWKNVVALLLPQKPKKILDVATGTGTWPLHAQTHAAEIVGIRYFRGMLDIK